MCRHGIVTALSTHLSKDVDSFTAKSGECFSAILDVISSFQDLRGETPSHQFFKGRLSPEILSLMLLREERQLVFDWLTDERISEFFASIHIQLNAFFLPSFFTKLECKKTQIFLSILFKFLLDLKDEMARLESVSIPSRESYILGIIVKIERMTSEPSTDSGFHLLKVAIKEIEKQNISNGTLVSNILSEKTKYASYGEMQSLVNNLWKVNLSEGKYSMSKHSPRLIINDEPGEEEKMIDEQPLTLTQSHKIFNGILGLNPAGSLDDRLFFRTTAKCFYQLYMTIQLHMKLSECTEHDILHAIVSEIFGGTVEQQQQLKRWFKDKRFEHFLIMIMFLGQDAESRPLLLERTFFDDDVDQYKLKEMNQHVVVPILQAVHHIFAGDFFEKGPSASTNCLAAHYHKRTYQARRFAKSVLRKKMIYKKGINEGGPSKNYSFSEKINASSGTAVQSFIVMCSNNTILRAKQFFLMLDFPQQPYDYYRLLECLMFRQYAGVCNYIYDNRQLGQEEAESAWGQEILSNILHTLQAILFGTAFDELICAKLKSTYGEIDAELLRETETTLFPEESLFLYKKVYFDLLLLADFSQGDTLKVISKRLYDKFLPFRKKLEPINRYDFKQNNALEDIANTFATLMTHQKSIQNEELSGKIILSESGTHHYGHEVINHLLHAQLDKHKPELRLQSDYCRYATEIETNQNNRLERSFQTLKDRITKPSSMSTTDILRYVAGGILSLAGLALIGYLTVQTGGLIHLSWLIPAKFGFAAAGGGIAIGTSLLFSGSKKRRRDLTDWFFSLRERPTAIPFYRLRKSTRGNRKKISRSLSDESRSSLGSDTDDFQAAIHALDRAHDEKRRPTPNPNTHSGKNVQPDKPTHAQTGSGRRLFNSGGGPSSNHDQTNTDENTAFSI